MVLYRNGKYSDAVGMLAKNLETNRELYYASAAYVTAMCHAKLGDRPEAVRFMQLATNWDPADEEFNYLDQREANLLRAEAKMIISNTGLSNTGLSNTGLSNAGQLK